MPFTKFVLVKTQALVSLVEINFVGLPADSYAADAAAAESSIDLVLPNRRIDECNGWE